MVLIRPGNHYPLLLRLKLNESLSEVSYNSSSYLKHRTSLVPPVAS